MCHFTPKDEKNTPYLIKHMSLITMIPYPVQQSLSPIRTIHNQLLKNIIFLRQIHPRVLSVLQGDIKVSLLKLTLRRADVQVRASELSGRFRVGDLGEPFEEFVFLLLEPLDFVLRTEADALECRSEPLVLLGESFELFLRVFCNLFGRASKSGE